MASCAAERLQESAPNGHAVDDPDGWEDGTGDQEGRFTRLQAEDDVRKPRGESRNSEASYSSEANPNPMNGASKRSSPGG